MSGAALDLRAEPELPAALAAALPAARAPGDPLLAADTAAVVLAGGRASRLGGIDKTALARDGAAAGASLLAEAVRAASGCARTVVVGLGNRPGGATDAQRRAAGSARLVDEQPAHGGPAAALAAGVRDLSGAAPTAWILVLAADLARAPEAAAALLPLRRDAVHAAGRDAILARDPDGRAQPLLALYRATSLRAALAAVDADAGLDGASVRRVLAALDADRIAYADLPARLCADVDTPADALAHGLRLPDDRIPDDR
ncbi:molybdopterin-guanine dinucleotide biosynthesis protein A [Clavibacter sp. B3I6]|uniref:NTP transferase domain-containing protein n=1 Tax=Clavibacter sp. B3I6 TaxID=3042268 RepID=UPI0027874B61|nr:NTP transferase domain-containing protein [Clavibacter sp. B3I6]MDQ0743560.1 molybdopterin-guanine dinucleotide biosynthesis protein A [Clavibacter sp. B3I6]